jgi:hypothetical protein
METTIPYPYSIACAFQSNCMGPMISSRDHMQLKALGFVVFISISGQILKKFPNTGHNCLLPKSYLTTIHSYISILFEATQPPQVKQY